MFKRYNKGRRHTNILIVIFRLILSLVMFAVLISGMYVAYKHFSGMDPLQLDPVAVLKDILKARTPQQFIGALPSFKIVPKILGKKIETDSQQILNSSGPVSQTPLFQFLVIADPHTDNVDLNKAIAQAKSLYPDLKFIIGLGDYSDVGTIDELKKAKTVFDAASLRYFLIPGDHDLWDCRNRNQVPQACFNEVFGPSYQDFDFDNFEFLLIDNSDDYQGISDTEKKWIEGEFERFKSGSTASPKGIFVFVHEPLYHPSSDHVMGKTEPSLKQQARDLMFELKDAGVKEVFAGDIHFFSQYSEPVTGLSMVTIGAVTSDRNPQTPRFAVVSVFGDGSTKIEDIEIK